MPTIDPNPRWKPGGHLDWAALLRSPPEDLVLGHDMGHAAAPDSPGGRYRLELRPDGRLALAWWRDQDHRSWTGRCAPPVFTEFAGLLAEGGFPSVPDFPLRPGVSFRALDARTGGLGVSAHLSISDLEETPPFDRLFLLADTLVYRLSSSPVPAWKTLLDVAVEERQEH